MTHDHTPLWEAKAEIEAILKKHDLIGTVNMALHTGNGEVHGEAIVWLEASWCKASLVTDAVGREGVRLRSKNADYANDPDPNRKDNELGATVGAVELLGLSNGGQAMLFLNAAEQFKEAAGVETTDPHKVHKS